MRGGLVLDVVQAAFLAVFAVGVAVTFGLGAGLVATGAAGVVWTVAAERAR